MRSLLCFTLFVFLVVGCSSDDEDVVTASSEETAITVEYKYLDHNRWIYAQMNRHYLWRDDLPDSLECDYSLLPADFFESILSDQDRFSYMYTNSSYDSSSSEEYGFAYQLYADKSGSTALQILYVASTEAREAGLKRGELYQISDSTSMSITLTHVKMDASGLFVKDDVDSESTIATSSSSSTVILDSIYNIGGHTIGYMCYTEFDEKADLYEPLQQFADSGISDLILDLRYNPGGYVATSQYLSTCIVSEQAYGQIFEQLVYNDIISEYYRETTGDEKTYFYFGNPSEQGKLLGTGYVGLNLSCLYVITSSYTASASEALITGLRPFTDVVIIGETTVGKGVGSYSCSDDNYKYALQPITFRYYNANYETVSDDGLTPDYYIADGYSTRKTDLGDIEEPMLNQALQLICLEAFSNTLSAKRVSGVSEQSLIPVGVPSFVTEYTKKQHTYEN